VQNLSHRLRRQTLWQRRKLVLVGKRCVNERLFPAAQPSQQLRQTVVALRADDEVHRRRASHDFAALSLGDAAGYCDQRVFADLLARDLDVAQPAKVRIDLLRRLFPDVAGVEDREIRLRRVARLDKALRSQRLGHPFRVVDIHLAAKRSQEHPLRLGPSILARGTLLFSVSQGREIQIVQRAKVLSFEAVSRSVHCGR
jgi:hypothetical protein